MSFDCIRQRQHTIASACEYALTRFPAHDTGAGKLTESRQHRDLGTEHEAGNLHRIVTGAMQTHRRMKMARDHISARIADRQMTQNERSDYKRFRDGLDAQIIRRTASMPVVIAEHEL